MYKIISSVLIKWKAAGTGGEITWNAKRMANVACATGIASI